MILEQISITNFKNIAEAALEFSPNLNAFLGQNGMGKSNLLDAIYYMSFCRSFSGMTDAQLIRSGEQFAMVKAHYLRREVDEELSLGITPGRRKSFKRQGKEYQRISSHIGLFPLVMVSPRDMDIVGGAPEERRRFLDMIISQDDAVYLDTLINYNELLQQRNRLLRQEVSDPILYEAIEGRMSRDADYITQSRIKLIDSFRDIFSDYYRQIAQSKEDPKMELTSQIIRDGAPLEELLDRNRRRDLALGYTATGPHRDDLTLTLNGLPVRTTASQGQQKTFTIAMRMAQYNHLRRCIGMAPLLLLDDIFDKLDAERVANIVDVVSRDTFGQIFITDTNRDHLDTIMSQRSDSHRLWSVDHGRFTLH